MVPSPLDPSALLEPLGLVEHELAPGLRQIEIYTMRGLLSLQWYGPVDASRLVVACPGGMGGFLGPGRAMFPILGRRLADMGIGTIVVDYRRPSDLRASVLDVVAAIDLGAQRGAAQVVAIGHSFGGAVAVNVGLALPTAVVGVCTLSTQSAGCELVARLAPRPLLLIHGELDEVLPAETSEIVRQLAGGHGVVEIVPGEGHGLTGSSDALVDRLVEFVTPLLRGAGS